MTEYVRVEFHCWNCGMDYQIYITDDLIVRVFFWDDKQISPEQYLSNHKFKCVHCNSINDISISKVKT